MKDNYTACFDAMIVHEGGFVNDKHDPGGATNLGVTIYTLTDWLSRRATVDDVKKLTKATVNPIYKRNYWDKIRGDDLPCGLDYAVFDIAVNSGPKKAATLLQTVVGTDTDGSIGPHTLKAAHYKDIREIIIALCNERMAFLNRLPTWHRFGRGWGRRVEEVKSLALKMESEHHE